VVSRTEQRMLPHPQLLAKLMAEVRVLRDGFWAEHYRSLDEIVDTLKLAHEILATKAA